MKNISTADFKIRNYFNATSSYYYDHYSKRGSLGEELLSRYLKFLSPLAKDKRVLEIGCGAGAFTSGISKVSRFSVGVDFAREMVQIAKTVNISDNLIVGDAFQLPFKDKAFEMVYFIRTFQHLTNRQAALNEAVRVLSDDGIVVFDFMNIINPLGFIRAFLSRFSKFVYLKADSCGGIKKICRQANIEVLNIYPLQLLLDSSNVKKYLPGGFGNFVTKLFKFSDFELRGNSFLGNFALRLLLVGKKNITLSQKL